MEQEKNAQNEALEATKEKAQEAQEKAQKPAPNDEAEHKTIVKKRERGLLAAIGIFAVAMAAIAILGLLLMREPDDTTQGQADCDAVRVSGKLPGRIVHFYVHEGDYVYEGDTLVSIYSSTADAALYKARSMQDAALSQNQKVEHGTRSEIIKTAENAVQQAQAAEEIARKTYERMENLYKEGVVSEQKRDEAKAAYDAASAAVRTATSQLELARNGAQREDKNASRSMANVARGSVMEVQSLLEDQILVAPCDGEVSEIYPHEGELVSTGTPIMTISRLEDMWVSFSVREDYLTNLTMGKEINVTIPALGDKAAKMKVFYIHDMGSYAAWNATKATGQYDRKTFEVKARPVTPIENFRPGMSVLLKK
ncbi:MAG: efflux RND transporter periplasmic adaptor subunit [Muribaculaceae bacterium]|nr:efflux RND transporter periplasmic adaptor subunit [Muribaculaceae bacterium]